MSSIHLVHSSLRPVVEALPPSSGPDARMKGWRAMPVPPLESEPGLDVSQRHIPGPEGEPDVRVVIYRPDGLKPGAPSLLHMHGGGYVLGNPELDDFHNRRFAKTLGCLLVSVDYRLAPEHPYPAPLEDCYAALRWLHANAGELGVDPNRIAVKGESAGGGLAAALCLLARDRKGPPIASQCLVYPMIDDRVLKQPHPYVGEFVWTEADSVHCWNGYLAGAAGGANISPYAAPARADDLANLPPAAILTGALDLFVDEDIEYARRLVRVGVSTSLFVYPGAFHGFHTMRDTAIYQRYFRDTCEALADAWG